MAHEPELHGDSQLAKSTGEVSWLVYTVQSLASTLSKASRAPDRETHKKLMDEAGTISLAIKESLSLQRYVDTDRGVVSLSRDDGDLPPDDAAYQDDGPYMDQDDPLEWPDDDAPLPRDD